MQRCMSWQQFIADEIKSQNSPSQTPVCRSVMAQLAAALEGEGGNADWGGAEYVRIEGGTDQRDRREACTRFRDDPAVRVALLSVTAAGAHPQLSRCCQSPLPVHDACASRP